MRGLLRWFDENRRDLPWRRFRTPYTAWIAEIMLQQTRVETVIPYFERWLERFPDVETLAHADEQDVLKQWEGLGYYSRARSLLKCAKIIAADCGGVVPRDPVLLQRLPGIGAYTAGAIASIAYGEPAAALDGNIRRILARYRDIAEPVREAKTEKRLRELAEEYLDRERPGDHNEALMDLGAGVCLPRDPRCGECPLAEDCLARIHGTVGERPVSVKAAPIPHYESVSAVMQNAEGRYLLAKRDADGLLGGMWEFPGGRLHADETLNACLRRTIRERLGIEIEPGAELGCFRHTYTHFKETRHAVRCEIRGEVPQNSRAFYAADGLKNLPMGKIDRAIADTINENGRKD